MPLTDLVCKIAKPSEKIKKLYDGKGLYLEVMPNQSKYWRFKYRFSDKEKKLALGVYPAVSLTEAREKRDSARKLLQKSIDPSEVKKEQKRQALMKTENSFEAIAREWHDSRSHNWDDRHSASVLRRLKMDIFGKLGSKPIHSITAPDLLPLLRDIESRGAIDMAHRVLQICGQIFRYGVSTGRCERDVAADLKGALKPTRLKHYHALQKDDLAVFMKKVEAYEGRLETKLALRLLLLTFVRTTELREATWKEIDLDAGEWHIPKERMKNGKDHVVPLSRQAIEAFRELESLKRKGDSFTFPSQKGQQKPMSENTVLYALYRMGYQGKATGHGFRSTASTLLNEMGFASDVIERQLAHVDTNKARASYNKAQYLDERKRMMQHWADTLDELAICGN